MLRAFNALMILALLFFSQYWSDIAVAAESSQANYPHRPVRILVGFAPGGSDIPARILAQKLYEKLGQPFIVDNRPGAGGIIGTDIASKATADGYTLLFATASFPVTAVTFKKLPYDPIKDFTAIVSIGSVPFTLVTHPSVSANSIKAFIALAKAQPGKLNYASTGTGAVGHLASVLFNSQTGISVTHVPYKGTGPAIAAVIIGEVQFMLPHLMAALPHLLTGKLKALGVASKQRSPLVPDLPTMTESGVPLEEGTWYGVLAPNGTPKSVIGFLNREIIALLRTKDLHDKLASMGIMLDFATPEEFWKFIRSEMNKWSRVIKDAGISPE